MAGAGAGRLVYIDSNIWIAWASEKRENRAQWASADRLIRGLDPGGEVAIFTNLLRTEILSTLEKKPAFLHDPESRMERMFSGPMRAMIDCGRAVWKDELADMAPVAGATGDGLVDGRMTKERLLEYVDDHIEEFFGARSAIYACHVCGRKAAFDDSRCKKCRAGDTLELIDWGYMNLEMSDLAHVRIAAHYGAERFYTFDRAFLNLSGNGRVPLNCMVWNYGR